MRWSGRRGPLFQPRSWSVSWQRATACSCQDESGSNSRRAQVSVRVLVSGRCRRLPGLPRGEMDLLRVPPLPIGPVRPLACPPAVPTVPAVPAVSRAERPPGSGLLRCAVVCCVDDEDDRWWCLRAGAGISEFRGRLHKLRRNESGGFGPSSCRKCPLPCKNTESGPRPLTYMRRRIRSW